MSETGGREKGGGEGDGRMKLCGFFLVHMYVSRCSNSDLQHAHKEQKRVNIH